LVERHPNWVSSVGSGLQLAPTLTTLLESAIDPRLTAMTREGHETGRRYEPPTVTIWPPVVAMSGSHTLLAGVKLAAAFASSVVADPGQHDPAGVGGVAQGGGSSGLGGGSGGLGGGGGGAGGGGGKLPFTGLAVAGMAAVGASLAMAGEVLRRLARRPPSHDGR
jgi:hypothetical protein